MLGFRHGTGNTERAEEHIMGESLARKLRVLRAERGWTLHQAAERAGVQPETISDAEHGKRRPYTPTLTKVARGYGVPVEELLEEGVLAGKAEAPETGQAGDGRQEYEEDVGVALSILMEDCAQDGRELEEHLKSLDNAYPLSAYPFLEKLSALEALYKEIARGRQLPEELREARQQLDAIASRIDMQTNQLIPRFQRPEDSTRGQFVSRNLASWRRHQMERQDVHGTETA
jgi:transcriptional regulator with XRE-family HTH domain